MVSCLVLPWEIKRVQGYLKFQRTVLKMTVDNQFCFLKKNFEPEYDVKESNHTAHIHCVLWGLEVDRNADCSELVSRSDCLHSL